GARQWTCLRRIYPTGSYSPPEDSMTWEVGKDATWYETTRATQLRIRLIVYYGWKVGQRSAGVTSAVSCHPVGRQVAVIAQKIGIEETEVLTVAVDLIARIGRPVPIVKGKLRVDHPEQRFEAVAQLTMPAKKSGPAVRKVVPRPMDPRLLFP